MKKVRLRNLEIGEGVPKICVPIVGKTSDEMEQAAGRIAANPVQPDMVELRMDWCEDILQMDGDSFGIQDLLKRIRERIGELPLLFTFRTAKEGGERDIGWESYQSLLLSAAHSGCVDAVDVEAFSFEKPMEEFVRRLHEENVAIIGSNHDFHKTPSKEEMLRRLLKMRDMHMDIAKIAVMPIEKKDVLALLEATLTASEDESMCPVITMSMSSKGVISRICGECFGSAVTFAAIGAVSAPGQIAIGQMREALDILHQES